MLEVKNITKVYGKKTVLDNVSFSAQKGEIIGLLGPNGAGKSTAMNIMTGFISATSGSVSYNGKDILDDALQAKKQFGYLPETPPLYGDMTVSEYLNFVYDLKKVTLNRKKHIEEVASVTRTDGIMKKEIKILSRGYRQRVGMAGAIIGSPEVIILDEPTAGLDPAQIVETRNLVRILGREHTVIISSHLLGEIESVVDRILVLSEGKLVADATSSELASYKPAENGIKIRILGPRREITSFLQTRDGISSVRFIDERDGQGVLYSLKCAPDVDIKKNLFFALAEKKWPITLLEDEGTGLEEIFLNLTGYTGSRRNKGGKK